MYPSPHQFPPLLSRSGVSWHRRGSALLIAVSVLGVIFVMGLLVSFNSSQELDQTSQAVYRSICLELAESACEEAAGIVLADAANVPWRVGIYEVAATSDVGKMGSRENSDLKGANPYVGGTVTDKLIHTRELCENFVGHFGKFKLESAEVTLRQIQPILFSPDFMKEENFYRPKDRGFTDRGGRPFVTEPKKHRDWQGQFEINAHVSYRGVRARATLVRDLKVVNVAPIARQYSLFSMFGPTTENEAKNDLNEGGILSLNNNKLKGSQARLAKFSDQRARVYLRGPYEIKVEANTPYSKSRSDKIPDNIIAYDTEDPMGYKGWSTMPEPRSLWDLGGTGHIPTEESRHWFLDVFKGIWKGGEKYYRGSIDKQRFVPSLYNLLGRPRGPLNKTDSHWDNDENSYGLEHYWDPDDKSVEKKYIIAGIYRQATIWPGFIEFPATEKPEEFRFSKINPSWWRDLIAALKRVTLVWNPAVTLGGKIINFFKSLFGKGDGEGLASLKLKNTLPTNYKDFLKSATRVVENLDELYRLDDPNTPGVDESLYRTPDGTSDGSSQLPVNGIYYISKKCVFEKETTFTGKGMVVLTGSETPLTVKQSIHPPMTTPAGEVLSLIFHPQKLEDGGVHLGDPEKDQLMLTGKNLWLNQVSLFSLFGLRSEKDSKHILCGNYVNWFMKKAKQLGDLIIDYPQPVFKYTVFREEDNNDIFLKAWDYATTVSPVVAFFYAR